MKVLTLRQVLILHEEMVRRYGGSSGVRDQKMLESAIYRPLSTFAGNDLYPDIFFKTAALIQSIIKNHPFIDGNKRTAFAAAFIFMKKAGYDFTAKNKEVVDFAIRVANENLSVDEIATWIRKFSKKS